MKKSLTILLIAAILLASSLGVAVFAASAGSADDPLVTKSYLESVVADLKKSGTGSSSGSYIVLENLAKGTLVVGGNSTEMILRTGTAVAYIPASASGGLSDLTAGANVNNNKSISLNHLMLFPRDDGRGIKITKDGAYIMVKGDYTIQ